MTKSRTLRRAGAVVLSLAMAATTVFAGGVDSKAASKVKLSSTSKTFAAKGGTATVKIKGATSAKISSTTVKSSKTSVATVKKSSKVKFKVTAKKNTATKKKTATITAKVKIAKKYQKKYTKKSYSLKYKVTVKAAATPTLEPTATPEDHSSDVTISDASGLQSDGTALAGDTFKLTYGSAFGTPQSITWYVNGATKLLVVANNGSIQLNQTTDSTWEGDVYAIVENTKNERKQTNTIKVSTSEQAVTLSKFALSEDYTTFANLTFDTKTSNYVAEATISKNVAGKFYLVKDDVTSFVTANTVGAGAALDASVLTLSANYATVTADNATDKKVLAGIDNDATGVTNVYAARIKNSDGTVTYRFKAPELTRGSSYKMIFDQKNIDADTINTGASDAKTNATTATPNISEAAEAKYLTKPSSIEVTKRVKASAPEVTVSGEDTKPLAFFGAEAGTALSSLGVSEFKVYECTGSAKTSGEANAAINTASVAKEGVITGNNNLADKPYYYAAITFKKGIFAADKIDLESAVVEQTGDIAKSIKVEADSTNVNDAKITLDTVKGAGTLYVINAADLTIGQATSADKIKAKALGNVAVEKGDTVKTIAGIITKAGDYYAAIVPTEAGVYQMKVDGNALGAVNEIAQKATTVKVGDYNFTAAYSSPNLTVKGLYAYDQYGNIMKPAADTAAANATVTPINTLAACQEAATAAYVVEKDTGLVIITVADNSTASNQHDPGEGYKVSLLGTDLEITNAANSAKVWTNGEIQIKVGSSKVTIAQVLSSAAAVNAGTTFTSGSTALTLKDQFGDTITLAQTITPAVTVGASNTGVTAVSMTIAPNGTMTAALTGSAVAGDTYSFKVGSSTVTMSTTDGTAWTYTVA